MKTHEVQAILQLAEAFPDASVSEIAVAINKVQKDTETGGYKYADLATLAAKKLSTILG